MLAGLADQEPDATALTLTGSPAEERTFSRAALLAQARTRARLLRDVGVEQGDLVLILTQDRLDQIGFLLGCMAIGALPAILPIQLMGRSDGVLEAALRRLEKLSGRLLVASAELVPDLDQLDRSKVLVPVPSALEQISPLQPHGEQPGQIALIQFSSGSSGASRPLLISHRALLNQARSYAEAAELVESDVCVSWSPLCYSLGLIGNLLIPLLNGIPTVHVDTALFLRRPALFFEHVHRFAGTVSRWPNFAFLNCAQRVRPEDLAGVSLESLRLIAAAAEPVSADARDRFERAFAAHGLRPGVVRASYGLSENTLCTTLSPADEPFRTETISATAWRERGIARPVDRGSGDAWEVVSTGRPLPGTELRILDGEGRHLGDRVRGEVGIRSGCLLSGIHPDQPIPEQELADGYLRTGDLGYLAEGRLYVTGRSKELILSGGVSIHPEQIERLTSRVDGIDARRIAACGLLDPAIGTEQIVVVIETSNHRPDDRQRIAADFRASMLRSLGVLPGRIVFHEPEWIPRTDSGKVARQQLRQVLLDEFAGSQ